jgi:anti-anti-sigma factor
MFDVSTYSTDSFICLSPQGRLDALNSSLFKETIESYIDKRRDIIIDFGKCNYLSSSGIRLLLEIAKKLASQGRNLMLSSLTSEVHQVLEMTGLSTSFTICKDVTDAAKEISGRDRKRTRTIKATAGYHTIIADQIDTVRHKMLYWKGCQLAGYNELVIAAGKGSPGEYPEEQETNMGIFATIGNCSGFIPFEKSLPGEFRTVKDSASGCIYVCNALSTKGSPCCRIRISPAEDTSIEEIMPAISEFLKNNDMGSPGIVVLADNNPVSPSLSLVCVTNATGAETIQGKGVRFILNTMPDLLQDESLLDFSAKALTIHNIEKAEICGNSLKVSSPVCWVFSYNGHLDAERERVVVETVGNLTFEPYKYYLVRRLYADSSLVKVKELHGGYSAQTFYVDSYDNKGRKLRPTVMKMAGKEIISREAERCQKFSLPYIMNNSAMVLGTAYYNKTGALRYNFVGIGGEQSQLQWLTNYFNSWPLERLDPLFDKIFMQILKPWYGQPVREKIYPYKEHNPLTTFFPDLCETAEQIFSISADDMYMDIAGTGKKRISPYWFLKHEYPRRLDLFADYYTSVCHGDLNMQNILLDESMNVYLIDFSETKIRSVISDFARLEAIFVTESCPLENENDLKEMIGFISKFYDTGYIDEIPDTVWSGKNKDTIDKNLALTLKMRSYAHHSAKGERSIMPYYVALLEWVLPIVCYSSTDLLHKKLSAYISGAICEKLVNI